MDADWIRSGRYPVLSSFGFNDIDFNYNRSWPAWLRFALRLFHARVLKNRAVLPYNIRKTDIQESAFRHCELLGRCCGAKSIRTVEMSTFGHPQDVFEAYGKKYSIHFLGYYQRYCFAHETIGFRGDETIVELGSGAGTQVELLKKVHPGLTVLCLDLPAQICLCETYLREALGREHVIGTEATLGWSDLSRLEKGRVHCFGNWQIPLLKNVQFDLFWNAASFGEMEPTVVRNYLGYILGGARWIYLLQARRGKETRGANRVLNPISFEDYKGLLTGYCLKGDQDAWQAHKRLSASGGYFEAVWAKERGD